MAADESEMRSFAVVTCEELIPWLKEKPPPPALFIERVSVSLDVSGGG